MSFLYGGTNLQKVAQTRKFNCYICARKVFYSECACNHFKNKKMSNRYLSMAIVVPVCLIASNLFESKIFMLGPLELTGGFLVFPVSYILNDCLTEVYGYRNARRVILYAFALNAFFVGMSQLVRILPGAPLWDGQEHFDYVFAADLRVSLASMLAFLSGSLLNSKVMAVMKSKSGEKGFGWRAVLSSLAGETLDSLVFFPIAFCNLPVPEILKLMLIQIFLKTLYESSFFR